MINKLSCITWIQMKKYFKKSGIRILALRYRDKIQGRLFDELIKYEVHPYSSYCKCQYKIVGFLSYKNVGKPTRLYDILCILIFLNHVLHLIF